MKFKTTPYHFDLLKDEERLSAFYEAIKELSTSQELAYDLGCGSGILSFFLNSYFKEMGYTVSGSGAVYRKTLAADPEKIELGLIPSYLEFLFKERKSVKKEMLFHYKNKILLQKFKMAAEADGLLK